MKIVDPLIAQFKHEMISTTKMLERVPFDKFDWKPHEKSMDLGGLARHIAAIAGFGALVADTAEADFAKRPAPPEITSTQVLVDSLKSNIARSIASMEKLSDEAILQDWTLRNGSDVIFTLPRIAALRGFMLSHLIHHRGQLSVYLRLLNISVPSIYGPSADEQRAAA